MGIKYLFVVFLSSIIIIQGEREFNHLKAPKNFEVQLRIRLTALWVLDQMRQPLSYWNSVIFEHKIKVDVGKH